MPVVDVTRRWSAEEITTNSPDNKNFKATATDVYDVILGDPTNDDCATALLDPRIPILRQSHRNSFYLRCTDVDPKRVAPNRVEVTCEYEATCKLTVAPWDMPPDIEWDFVTTEEEVDQDANGAYLGTICGEPFDPPLRDPISDLVLRVTRNVKDFDPSQARAYMNTVNGDVFMGQPKGTAKINIFKASSVNDTDLIYFKRVVEIQFRRGAPRTTDDKAWWRRVAASGFYFMKLDPTTQKMVIARATDGDLNPALKGDDAKRPTSTPVLHDTTTGALILDPKNTQWYERPRFQLQPFANAQLP